MEFNKIIAVDFDGTLAVTEFPRIIEAKWDVILRLKEEQKKGAKVILWTCRSGSDLDNAISFCNDNGITFNAINSNLPEQLERFPNDCRKIFADEYWDDKAVKV